MNPRISSELVESAAPAARSDAPKAGVVMIAGPAGRGPTEPVTIEDPADAYRIFGTEGDLADDIVLALQGAEIGGQAADNRVFGQVKALRTETGTSASATLKDSEGNDVITLQTAASGRSANEWYVLEESNAYKIYDPDAGEEISFAVDRTGNSVVSRLSTPTELANGIRQTFGGRLEVEAKRHRAHFEISVSEFSDANTDLSISSDANSTEIDFSSIDNTAMQALQPGSLTWIDGDAHYFDGSKPSAHKNILSSENSDARFYAITAGGAVEGKRGNETIRIPGLADASRIGDGSVDTLLNLRTTGEGSGAASAISLSDAARRQGSKVSEAYWRVRKAFVDRLDPSDTATYTDATISVKTAVTTVTVDVSQDFSMADVDGTSVAEGDLVLLAAQSNDAENGVYEVTSDGSGGLTLNQIETSADLTNERVTDTGSSAVYTYDEDTSSYVTTEPATNAIQVEFNAPAGIADAGGALSQAYATDLGDGSTAAELSTDRLGGDHFEDGGPAIKMWISPITNQNNLREIDLDFDGGSKGVTATIDWTSGSVTILLDEAEFREVYGSDLDDGQVYVSYDSCIFDLNEVTSVKQLDATASEWQYAVDGFDVTFNRPLDADIVLRGLTVTQYRMGDDIEVERTAEGANKFIFQGRGNQPGEAGKGLGKIETILGFDYNFEGGFPSLSGKVKLAGATSGVNADSAKKAEALEAALEKFSDEDYMIIVPSGLHVDETKDGYDPITGAATEESVDVLSVLETHQDRLDQYGSSGIIYAAVTPMKPSDASLRYTADQKRQRFLELTAQTAPGETTAGSIIQAKSRPETFIFDAPMQANVAGRSVRSNGAAFFAGLRSALPGDRAMYNVTLPSNRFSPLYRYNVSGEDLPGELAENRINTWSPRRGEVRLADERTAAGTVLAANGQSVASNFQSGIALLGAKKFQQRAVAELENLLGPMPSGGADVLRATVVSILQGVAERTRGVQGLPGFEPQRDINIRPDGGSAIALLIRPFIQVAGELRRIELSVGAVTELNAGQQEGTGIIPTAS